MSVWVEGPVHVGSNIVGSTSLLDHFAVSVVLVL